MLTCSQCGTDITGSSISGRCPACMLALALGDAVGEKRDKISSTESESLGIKLPHSFGDYVLLEEIGRGGMGLVYRARHEKLSRDVALKLVLAGAYADPENRLRFLEESRVAASLQHPNIVTLFDAGDQEGTPYYTMELIHGSELGQLSDQRALTPSALSEVLGKIARAVQFAHEHHIIHRDLKPSNILIDAAGEPQITDFGLAKRDDGPTNLTISNRLIGTPGFWPPEQLEENKSSGASGDIYALGAILYFGLVNRPPFQADSLEALLLQIVSNEPIPPRRLNPDIPHDLETICLKCLEKKPSQRYDSAGELADDLDRFLDGKPIRARPVGALTRVMKWSARKPALAVAIALLVLTFTIGFSVSLTQWQRADRHADKLRATVTALKLDRAETRLTDGSTDEGLALLATMVRENPENRAAAQRMVSALSQRNYLQTDPWSTSDRHFARASAFALHENRLLASTNEGRTLTIWNVENEPALERSIDVGAPIRLTAISRDGHRVLIITQTKQLLLYHLEGGTLILGPISLPERAEELQLSPDGASAVIVNVVSSVGGSHWASRGWVVDLANGSRVHDTVPFHAAEYSADGRHVVTTSRNSAVVRDAHTWEMVGMPVKDESLINTARLNPDGTILLTACADNNASLWNSGSGELLRRLPLPVNVLEAFFSPDGDIIFTRDILGYGQFWKTQSGEPIGAPFSQMKGSHPANFSPDGRRFMSYGAPGLTLRDTATGNALSESFDAGSTINGIRFLPDGRRFVSTSFANRVRMWNSQPTARASVVFQDIIEMNDARLSPDGAWLVAGIKGKWGRIWNAATGRTNGPRLGHDGAVRVVNWSPDSQRLLTVSRDHTARLWNAATAAPISDWMRHQNMVNHAEFSPDGRWVATSSDDHTARIWNATNGLPVSEPLDHGVPVERVHFSPDGALLATTSHSGAIRFWSVPEGVEIGNPVLDERHFNDLQFSPDGRLITTRSEDSFVRVWNLKTRQLKFPPLEHLGDVNDIEINPQGTRLVTASSDRTARIWSLRDGSPIGRPMRHQASVGGVTFSPDGRFVLTCSGDKTARIWDAATGHMVSDPFRHGQGVNVCQWSGDGRQVLTVSSDRTARLWPVLQAPDELTPDWLADLAEIRASLTSDGDQFFHKLPIGELLKTQQRLEALSVPGAWGECFETLMFRR